MKRLAYHLGLWYSIVYNMITRIDLRKITENRLEDAEVLYRNKRYDGAQYLVGYAVEIALKWRFCCDMSEPSFPETKTEFLGWKEKYSVWLKVHSLQNLVDATTVDLVPILYEWSLVAKWEPGMRYSPIGYAKAGDTRSMIDAAIVIVGAL